MKKFLSVLFATLIILSALTLTVSAKVVPFEKDYVSDGDIVLASFHNVKPFIADQKDAGALDEALTWIVGNAEAYNIKYVSFIGNMSSGANFLYKDIVTNQGKTKQELITMNETDLEWQKDFNLLRQTASQLSDVGVPYGVSIGLKDYCSDGLERNNHMQNCFQLSDFASDAKIEQVAYDNNSYATIITVGRERYIIYQLEAWPRQSVINWFNGVQADYPDARAIVYTTSFAQADGEMYTQHDWSLSKEEWRAIYKQFTTVMRTNLVGKDNPHDGDQLWKDAFASWDNILCIVSANASTGKSIVTKTFTNNNGVKVASVVADLESGYAKEDKAYPLLIKISEDNKTLDIRYVAPFDGYEGSSRVVIELDTIGNLPDPEPIIFLPKIPARSNSDSTAYINGYAGNLFKPNGNMTKAEACTIFARLLLGTQTIPDGYTTRFTDVNTSDWFHNAIAYLDETGFLYSTTTDTYNPNKPITRAEFVELAYLSATLYVTENITFTDVDVTNKYYDAIVAAAASGLVNGYEDNTFRPNNTITRAEVVTVINRLLSLYAGSDAISREHLTTIFSDIKGHWAENQILLASNSNVYSAQYYAADLSSITENASEITFGNDYVQISISKKNGKVTKIINLMTGEDIISPYASSVFAYVVSGEGATISPSSVDLVDGRLVFSFKDIGNIYLLVESFGNYFTLTLDSNLPTTISAFSFGNLAADYNWELDNENAFGLSCVAMTTTVSPKDYPGGSAKTTRGTVYTSIPAPTFGSKLGIAFSRMTEHRDHLKSVVDAIDLNKGIKSTHGGPYALDNKDVFYDYVILQRGLTPETAEETAKLAKEYSVEQIDIHRGGGTFLHAEFNFVCARTEEEKENNTFITAEVFKERIADKINKHGVQLSLHTFSSLVPSNATTIITNPKWQQQLCYDPQTYTVRGNISKSRTQIKTYEDASNVVVNEEALPYRGDWHTKYILIDEEIILIQQGTSAGFLNVKRGQLGTVATTHKDGAEIRHLLGWYGMFQSQPLSELFYHVAENTAKAYNEGGFEMIYLDGFESFARDGFSEKNSRYYIYAEFLRTVIANCDTAPLIEYSVFNTSLWNARARGGAVDHANRGYKEFKNDHLTKQVKFHDYFYTATVGWFHYAPDKDLEYKNALVSTLFRDDLDHMGSLALANDFSTVCQPFYVSAFNDGTMLADNFAYYGIYSRLREGGYFAPEVKKAILNGEYEYKVFKQADGTWAFKEMQYTQHRTYMLESEFTTGKATNPFSAQTPYVRIEQGYSSLGQNAVVVKAFDESQPVASAVGTHQIPKTDYIDNYAFMLRVQGNGSETDKVIVKFTSGTGSHEMHVPVNHTGWKDIVLVEPDDWGRAYCELLGVTSITISLDGNCTGVKIDDLMSVKIVDAPVSNPSVTINGKTMTFNAELKSGEYIEFYPETGKAYHTYYIYEYNDEGKYKDDKAFVKEITYTGSVEVPAGSYSYTYNATPKTDAPTRADVVIGVSGKVIKNPDNWVAPEVDIPDDLMEFKLS
ncbi:MAG: S-layer homology domain-containing protein [Clostridia bacterium]|nr:S-layer homology domain-containing protein [Clostridia bacterium]